jgi:two-component system NtrC family sensor kinase
VIEWTDLNGLVREVLEVVEGRAKELNLRVEVQLTPGLPRVPLDPEGIQHALLNIVTNAVDAVEERRKPFVSVATKPDPEAGWVRVVVMDNGMGIDPEKQADIFRPFVSSKGAKGTGLGLAVSRKILREHGGDILLQSQPGKGSCFILRLPLKSPLSQEGNGTLAGLPVVKPPPAN